MKTAQEIAQWVIDNRYPKSENDKVNDFEMYNTLLEAMGKYADLREKQVKSELAAIMRGFREVPTPPDDRNLREDGKGIILPKTKYRTL